MGQEPGEIREQIEETRGRMGETVDAIGYKADVKSRAGDYVAEKRDAVTGKADEVVSKVTGKMPDREQAKQSGRKAAGIAKENPLGLAIGGAAVGFLVGLALPSTSVEDRKVGDVSDEVKERAKETGQEALERGKQVAQEAGRSASETARESGQEHGQELTSTLRESAHEVRSRATEQ